MLGPRHQTGWNAIQTKFGDLDGDGFGDLVAVNGGELNPDPTVTILFGSGNGDFGTPFVLPTHIIGHTVAIGDLNDDGKPEIVAASYFQNALEVFINLGNRQFSPSIVTIPPNPGSKLRGEYLDLEIADFDGDGVNELVGLEDQSGKRLRFFRLLENGSLSVYETLIQIGQDTSLHGEIAVGDFNGDQRADVVLIGGDPGHVSFVFGQPVGESLSIAYGFQFFDRAKDIRVSDLDNDGDEDIVLTVQHTDSSFSHAIHVFRNNGNGTFVIQPRIFFDNPFLPGGLTTADLNNDGIQDLAVLLASIHDEGVIAMVTFGVGDTSFSGARYYAASSSYSIFAEDLNGNGMQDLVTASRFVLTTDYSKYVGMSNNTANVILSDEILGFRAPEVSLWTSGFIDAADFNGDSYLDMASAWKTFSINASSIVLALNSTESTFLPDLDFPSTTALNGMKVGDFNGDGHVDAVSVHLNNNNNLALFVGDGNGSLSEPIYTPHSEGVRSVDVGDFNSDGRDDVILTDDEAKLYTFLGNTDNTFTIAPNTPISLPPSGQYTLHVGDFNNDLIPDLILSRDSVPSLWFGDGTGGFTQTPVTIPRLVNVTSGDFNGDGNLDIAGMEGPLGIDSDLLTGLLGDGKGGFGENFSKQIRNFSHDTTQSIVSSDFDLDGFDDLAMIMSNNTFGNLIVVQSAGSTGAWKEPVFLGVGTAMKSLIAADFDVDGKPDIGFLGDNARGVIYNTAETSQSTRYDFDGDSKADISIFRRGLGEWWYLRSSDGLDGAFAFGSPTDVAVPADFTGDGIADFSFWRPSTSEWFVLRSDNTGFFSFPFGAAGDIPAPGDFDGDGTDDPAVFRPATGVWFILRSSDGQTEFVPFGAAQDKPLIGDYDGDGTDDVAVYKPDVGQYWQMRSTEGLKAFAFGAVGDRAMTVDFSGDGSDDMVAWRPSTGFWYVLRSEDSNFFGFPFGANGDIPAPADYDGDGTADATVFRPSDTTWYSQQSTNGAIFTPFGIAGDEPVPSAYNAD